MNNDSAFSRQTLIDFCRERADPSSPAPALTASGDQACIEQKNGAVVRRLRATPLVCGLDRIAVGAIV